jgi:radical SAM/Cys-rich protein
MESFSATLEEHGLTLLRDRTGTLQVNVGLLCNQTCRHCHLDAGPGRVESMSRRTVDDVVAYADRCGFDCVDITGGAPELLPDLDRLLEGMSPLCRKLMLRTNLTALEGAGLETLIDRCRSLRVTLVASFPSLNANQADAQRGRGVWEKCVRMLKTLNRIGYGLNDTGLELNLVVNPAGAFMPPGQCELEARYRRDLLRRWGISFNSLYSFANAPLGRFRSWLLSSGNYDQYLGKLAGSFNPDTVSSLMCRSLVSVSWEGLLYDCDFNQAAGLGHGDSRTHVTSQSGAPPAGTPVAVGDHCYACTAGAGFT